MDALQYLAVEQFEVYVPCLASQKNVKATSNVFSIPYANSPELSKLILVMTFDYLRFQEDFSVHVESAQFRIALDFMPHYNHRSVPTNQLIKIGETIYTSDFLINFNMVTNIKL